MTTPNTSENVTNAQKHYLLHEAINKEDIGMIDSLLQEKIDLNCQDYRGLTTLLRCILYRHPEEIVMRLIQAGCNPNIPDERQRTPLQMALVYKENDIAYQLIKHGADVNYQNAFLKYTPLNYAILSNNLEGVCMLLYFNADIDTMNTTGENPMVSALRSNDGDIISILLDYCDDFSYISNTGHTFLHHVQNNRSELALKFVQGGADINAIADDNCIAFEHTLSLGGTFFKELWPQLDYTKLLQIETPLLVTYLAKIEYFTIPQWLECFYLILSCNVASDLIQQCDTWYSASKNSNFMKELLYIFPCHKTDTDNMTKILSTCLSLGALVSTYNLDTALKYRFTKEFELLLYAADQCTASSDVHPLLPFMSGQASCTVFKLRNLLRYLKKNHYCLTTELQQANIISCLGFSSISAHNKGLFLEDYNLCDFGSPEIREKLSAIPEFPSLLELSRNAIRELIGAAFAIKKPYQFWDAVKQLGLPRHLEDLILFKAPLY